MMAKNSSCIHPQSSHSGHSNLASTAEISPDSLRSSVYKFNSNVVYEHLVVTHIPFELDYVQVVVSLFDCLERIYSMMMHEDTYT